MAEPLSLSKPEFTTADCIVFKVSQPSTSSQSVASDSDSDIDPYSSSRHRIRGNKKLQPRQFLKDASQDLTPNHSELRIPTRKAAKTTNYNEDDEDPFEDDEDMGVQSWIIEDETPGIDIVLDHRLRDDTGKPFSASVVNPC